MMHTVSSTTEFPAPDARRTLIIDQALVEQFGGRGPRYTSYPTADRLTAPFDSALYDQALHDRRQHTRAPLGIYVHIPFCRSICYYCGCNKIGTRHQDRSAQYLSQLETEIALICDRMGRDQAISHLHLGGGTPTFMRDDELERLFSVIRSHFTLAIDGEYSIEVDPRTVSPERLSHLRTLGLNRLSLGIQDFDPQVQQAVNRVQSFEQSLSLIRAARTLGFSSINADLIYGLPRQTITSFRRTLEQIIEASPDRIALYQYAHLPQLFKPQRRIVSADLPSAQLRAELFAMAVDLFQGAGYLALGLDHFAKPGDELAIAQREGRLHRNFQGYCAHESGDLIALGVSAISKVGGVMVQNEKTLDRYTQRLAAAELPIARGIQINDDDRLRQDVIQRLMCQFSIRWGDLDRVHGVDSKHELDQAIQSLEPMHAAGAIRLGHDGIDVLPRGRLLVRAVAMAFDRYLNPVEDAERYSRLA